MKKILFVLEEQASANRADFIKMASTKYNVVGICNDLEAAKAKYDETTPDFIIVDRSLMFRHVRRYFKNLKSKEFRFLGISLDFTKVWIEKIFSINATCYSYERKNGKEWVSDIDQMITDETSYKKHS